MSEGGRVNYANIVLHNAVKPRSIVVSLTNKCTAACDGCAFGSHPWVKGGLSADEVIQILDQAKRSLPSIALFVITGGEPLLRFQDLPGVISYAERLGLRTRVVSNAYWATTPTRASRILQTLRRAGLDEINFSTGDEHNKFVPFERVLLASICALDLGMVVAIMLEKRKGAKITEDTLFEHPLGMKMKEEHKGAFIVTPSPWIHTENIETFPSHLLVSADDLVNKDNIHKTGGCDSALRDIAVQPEGDVYACCGISMRKMPDWRLGHVSDIDFGEAYADSATDLLKILIATLGPAMVLDWASRKNPSIEWENRYSHPCEICYHI